MTTLHPYRRLGIFGSSDGLVACIGVVLATAPRGEASVVYAALGLLIAEGFGMAASEWLSADSDTGLAGASVMGLSTALAIFAVALPWLFYSGSLATHLSVAIAVLIAGVIAWARQGGWKSWAQTFGVLGAVALLAWGAGSL